MVKTKNHLLIYTGGVPTDAEVDLLLEKFGIPVPGQEIPYDGVEQILGINRNQNRWASVTGAWRKRLQRQHGIIFKCVKGAFKALTPDERVGVGVDDVTRGLKRMGRGVEIIEKTPPELLSSEVRRLADHTRKVYGVTYAAYVGEARKLEIPDPEVKRLTE